MVLIIMNMHDKPRFLVIITFYVLSTPRCGVYFNPSSMSRPRPWRVGVYKLTLLSYQHMRKCSTSLNNKHNLGIVMVRKLEHVFLIDF